MKNKIMCVIICLMLVGCGCPNGITNNKGDTVTYTIKSETRIGNNILIETKEITQEEAEKLKDEEALRAAKKMADEIKVMMAVTEAYVKAFGSSTHNSLDIQSK